MKFFLWLLVFLLVLGAAWYFYTQVKSVVTWLKSKTPRMIEWWLIAIALCAVISQLSPQQLPVSIYKISLIAIAGVVGYCLDRSLFPYGRPDSFAAQPAPVTSGDDSPLSFDLKVDHANDLLFAVSMLRRALIVAAAMVAVGLGA